MKLDHLGQKVRKDWIESCEFHDLSSEEVLREVARRVSQIRAESPIARGPHPIVLLDLDSTLYEVQPRTHVILREWASTPQAAQFPLTQKKLSQVQATDLGYSLKDVFTHLNLDLNDPEIERSWSDAKDYWSARFFSNDYLKHDLPYAGSAEFALEMHKLGAEIVYLTGRDEPRMGPGTREKLIADGFPLGVERTQLLLKPAPEMADREFKQSAVTWVKNHGTLISSFENEPPNVVAIYEVFPSAMHVFVDTVCSDHPAIPMKGLYRIEGFR